jgi:ribonuclease D
MNLIADSAALADFCQRLADAPYITVDTEFMRERTYWPQLCLVQVADAKEAHAIDPLAPGIDLGPLLEILAKPSILKVFHAARQDVEIFFHMTGKVPTPIFDTQVAAMVCGFGDAVSYETLASKLAKARIDKSQRFTDWSHRPLQERQLSYALADVTHLRQAYERLARQLEKEGRAEWVAEEMAILTDPATYRLDPEDAWRRLKPRTGNARTLMLLKALAAWREREAQTRDLPRQRVIRDEALLEIAGSAPATIEDLARTRGLSRGLVDGRMGAAILATVAHALETPESEWPAVEARIELPRGLAPVVDLLKVLLKLKCDENDVAQRLVANTADLEAIAGDDNAAVPAMHGWRRSLFGDDALRLKHGQVALD